MNAITPPLPDHRATAGAVTSRTLPLRAADGAGCDLIVVAPARPRAGLLWLPALGVAARHYLPLAAALAQQGVAVAVHEWRGLGSSDRRAGRRCDWGYRELLTLDIPASRAAAGATCPGLPWLLGGHSLGAQLAALAVARAPATAVGLIAVAGGVPDWRTFPPAWRLPLRSLYFSAPLLARLFGHYPGRRLRFAGNEARGVIADWAASGARGRYAAHGLDDDLQAALAALRLPVLGLADDRLVPAASLACSPACLVRCASRRCWRRPSSPRPASAISAGWARRARSRRASCPGWTVSGPADGAHTGVRQAAAARALASAPARPQPAAIAFCRGVCPCFCSRR